MGKAKGDPARSKTRPSSSSSAAALVQGPGIASSGFGGYVGSARVEPGPLTDGDVCKDVDGEASLHLRRLSKKDPTTKLKALASLRIYIKEHSGSTLATLMPPWIFEYKRLVQDSSRQVRESTHNVMSDLATAIGRGLGRHLRALMGAWWVSQFDSSREAGEAAQHSLQVAFPNQKKRVDALIFSLNDIFLCLDENLRLTPQTISDKSTPVDESTEKHERVISSSMLAIAALLDVIMKPGTRGPVNSTATLGSEDDNDTVLENARKARSIAKEKALQLFRDHRFFQGFLKSKNARIRSATYQVLRAFIQHVPEVFANADQSVVAGAVLGAFSEKDPSSHQPMWEMAILFAKTFPQAWDGKTVKKVVLPRFWGFLTHGCYGSQQVSYQYLLPFLSLIPPKAVSPSQHFLLDLFNSLWEGLEVCAASPADRQALLKVLQECLVWAVIHVKRYADEDGVSTEQLQSLLIECVLFKCLWCRYLEGSNPGDGPVLERPPMLSSSQTAVADQVSQQLPPRSRAVAVIFPEKFMGELATCIVDLLISFSKKTTELLATFWSLFHASCLLVIEEACARPQGEDDFILSRLSEFLLLLATRSASDNPVGEDWPLELVVRPFIGNLYSRVQSLGHPEAVRLLAQLAGTYGPPAFSLLFKTAGVSHDGSEADILSSDHEPVFKRKLMSWCLDGNHDLDSKVELLLAYIEWSNFEDEWSSILSHVTEPHEYEQSDDSWKAQQLKVLTALVQKIGEKAGNFMVKGDSKMAALTLKRAQSPILDTAAVRVVHDADWTNPSFFQLLRHVLGTEELPVTMLSTGAVEKILKELFKGLLLVFGLIDFDGVKSWEENILYVVADETRGEERVRAEISSEDVWNRAKFALDVIGNSIHVLLASELDCRTSAQILAAILCFKWAYANELRSTSDELEEYSFEDEFVEDTTVAGDVPETIKDEKLYELVSEEQAAHLLSMETSEGKAQFSFLESLKVTSNKVSLSFCEKLGFLSIHHLRSILSRCIRCAVFQQNHKEGHSFIRRAASWALELCEITCKDAENLDQTIELLLAPNECWPLWTKALPQQLGSLGALRFPGEQENDQELAFRRFASFLDALPASFIFFSHVAQSIQVEQSKAQQQLTLGKQVYYPQSPCRVWLIVELLCTWHWPSGGAAQSTIPFLKQCGESNEGTAERDLFDETLQSLFVGASASIKKENYDDFVTLWDAGDDGFKKISDPYLRALLMLLRVMLEKESNSAKIDALKVFREHIVQEESLSNTSIGCELRIAPYVLSILMPTLRKANFDETSTAKETIPGADKQVLSELDSAICDWLATASHGPPLVACESQEQFEGQRQWIRIVLSCFPLNPLGGASTLIAASSAVVRPQEKGLLVSLLRKQFSREAMAPVAARAAVCRFAAAESSSDSEVLFKREVELCLAKLVQVTVAYSWQHLLQEDWEFILSRIRRWLEAAVLSLEDLTESLVEAIKVAENQDSVEIALTNSTSKKKTSCFKLSSTAVAIFSLLWELFRLEGAKGTDSVQHLTEASWERVEGRALEDILRLLLATGLTEAAVAASVGGETLRAIIATGRREQVRLWDNVSEVALRASTRAREAAVRAADLWGVGPSSISGLYALLFSPDPIDSLQWTAYQFLSSEPLQQLAVTSGVVSPDQRQTDDREENASGGADDVSPAAVAHIRPELSRVLETPSSIIQSSSLISSIRVRYFLGWSLFLSHIHSLPALTQARERLVQYVEDSNIPSTLLDCIFQHMDLERPSKGSKKSCVTGEKLSCSAIAARRAASSGSVSFAVEGLWPIGKDEIATVAGALYSMMLRVLPACVRIWFMSVHNRGFAAAVEAFTITHCSPQLLAEEFTQVQASAVADESLFIRANRAAREVTAVYKKEEAGMDIVIRLPASYPLRIVDVVCTRRMGINETRLRKWILSMAAFLRNQNGAVAEAVQIWKGNVDQEFEGVEECPICYSIIHTSNHSLPKLACKTCKHKFHSACLYKWFSTSHKSTCPLCQTPF